MAFVLPDVTETPTQERREVTALPEQPPGGGVQEGWQSLHGNMDKVGYTIEWHDFVASEDMDWSRTFRPQCLEICLNLCGCAKVQADGNALALTPCTAGFYGQREDLLKAVRKGGERHQFLTLEFSWEFLDQHLRPSEKDLHPHLSRILKKDARSTTSVSEPMRLTAEQQQTVLSLRKPPVPVAARSLWYQAKALEFAALLLYRTGVNDDSSCCRQDRLNKDRVQKVIQVLKENLSENLSLEEIGRRVGCSHFYLCRIFGREMGTSICAYQRQLRMEQAALLLREGKLNVTEVAMAVGYSSPGHFSTAFHGAFGCCPGLYALAGMGKIQPPAKAPAQ